jgi:anti-sigma regulatory factor (Ser/Thr protein kinase)
VTLELHATPEEVMRAVEAFQEFVRVQQIPERTAFGLALALEECGSNVVKYALGGIAQQKFKVSFGCRHDEIFIELRDPGPEFDPTAWNGSSSGAESEEAIGGWGIQLVRRYMDEIRYERRGKENILRLSKQLKPEGGEFQKAQSKQS